MPRIASRRLSFSSSRLGTARRRLSSRICCARLRQAKRPAHAWVLVIRRKRILIGRDHQAVRRCTPAAIRRADRHPHQHPAMPSCQQIAIIDKRAGAFPVASIAKYCQRPHPVDEVLARQQAGNSGKIAPSSAPVDFRKITRPVLPDILKRQRRHFLQQSTGCAITQCTRSSRRDLDPLINNIFAPAHLQQAHGAESSSE